MAQTKAAELRQKVGHPIVDLDGHWLEPIPVLLDYLRDLAGPQVMERFEKQVLGRRGRWYALSNEERLAQRVTRGAWWVESTNPLDYATARVPRLFYERLDDLGVDFVVVYPTMGLLIEGVRDDEVRQAVCRAYNMMASDMFRPYADRMTPVAVIPKFTPEEAVAEATHAVRSLGMKTIMINGVYPNLTAPDQNGRRLRYIETLPLDNPLNYDLLWEACIDLGVAVTSHVGSTTWPDHNSPTNFVFNHLGHFAQANAVFAKAVFLGGLVRRFPALQFVFLEGGVAWARNLLNDMIEHWEKRHPAALEQNLRPDRIDMPAALKYFEQYADDLLRSNPRVKETFARLGGDLTAQELTDRERDHLDDFAASGITTKAELRSEFAKNFYFGCEADDSMAMVAFDPRMTPRLKACFSSDFGHWDVPSMEAVVPETYELVEKGFITDEDYRDFVFANTVLLHGRMNPAFFDGTVIEREARELLGTAVPSSAR
jgi:predicted TIM-barrel fold metal-dependent hydrolase